MKIIKDNSKNDISIENINIEPYPRKLTCEECGSELEYDKSDLRMGEYGCMFVDCPICGRDNMLPDNENNITLTVDNIEFPVHFHHVSVETGAEDVCNIKEIRYRLRAAIRYFRENKDETDWYTWSGNLFVFVHRWAGDENYEVVVSKDFYNMEIDFEDEDY